MQKSHVRPFGTLSQSLPTIVLAVAFAILMLTDTADATPTITNVSAPTLAEGQQITISGTGFGDGPNVVLFDNFKGGTPGHTVALRGAVGSWTRYSNSNPTYYADGHSDGRSMAVFGGGSPGYHQLKLELPAAVTEIYISCWVKIPIGYPFPGTNRPNTLPSISTWKPIWMFHSEDSTANNDVYMPAWTGGDFLIGGNDIGALAYVGHQWFQFGKWMRWSFWLRADPTNPATGPGIVDFKVFTDGTGQEQHVRKSRHPIFANSRHTPHTWKWVNFTGWAGNGPTGNSLVLFDDVYVAAGAASQARIEIADAPVYANAKHVAILTPVWWSNNVISAKLQSGSFPNFDNAYLYVFDKDGNVNARGYPLGSATSSGFGTGSTAGTGSSSTSFGSTSSSSSTIGTDPAASSASSGTGGTPYTGTPVSSSTNTSPTASGGASSTPSSSSLGPSDSGSSSSRTTSANGNFLGTSAGARGYAGSNSLSGSNSTGGSSGGVSTADTSGFTTSGGGGGTGSSSLAFPDAKAKSNQTNGSAAKSSTQTAAAAPSLDAYITNPKDGSTVSNTTTLSAYATAANGLPITLVKLFVDGTMQCAGAPSVSCQWDTKTSSNGSHMVSVNARDAAGNSTTDHISVNVNN